MRYRFFASLVLLAAISACSGGSGGGSDTPPTPTPPTPTPPAAPSMSLLAGNVGGRAVGTPSLADGPGVNARFLGPTWLAIDATGKLYVGDLNGTEVVRTIAADGTVATAAALQIAQAGPSPIAIDSGGNLYYFKNLMLRKIAVDGSDVVVAGSGGLGGADGGPTEASFGNVSDMTVDGNGNIYVAETSIDEPIKRRLRKVTPAGVVTTLPFTDQFAEQSVDEPVSSGAVAVDGSGNVYTIDNDLIVKITPDGKAVTLAGNRGGAGSVDGAGAAAGFSHPHRLAADRDGTIYVTDGNSTIRKITPAGVVTTLAGKPNTTPQTFGTPVEIGSADGPAATARFNVPLAIRVGTDGAVYVTDSANGNIRKISGGQVSTFAGPAGVANVVTGTPGTDSWAGSADGAGSAAAFNQPSGIAVDSTGNIIYVVDTLNGTIRKMTPAGAVSTLTKAFTPDTQPNKADIALDGAGNMYVPDKSNHVIRKITPAGVNTILAGQPGVIGSDDGPAATASFAFPATLTADKDGNVYLFDQLQYVLRKISAAGVVSTLAGTRGQSGHVDGAGSAARFSMGPDAGLVTDRAGNIYMTDGIYIRKITPTGEVTTLAGGGGQVPSGDTHGPFFITNHVDGKGAAAGLPHPTALTIDSDGNLYFVDGATVRKCTPDGVVTTVIGAPGQYYFVPGALPGTISTPKGLAISGRTLFMTMYNGVVKVQNLP
jgi:sugar lactone lactonase YvrE